ncbi:MAG: tetratricopeptide repeat protein [Bryobacteraceae bacterium]
MKIRVMLLLIALVAGLGANGRWVRLKSSNFELYTDAGESRGREVVLQLEQFRNVFAAQAADRNISPLPVRVFVFQSDAGFRPFRINEASSGYYHSGPDGDFIAMRASGRTAAHEFVHVVLRHSAREVPLWFGEGLAEFYSTIQFRGKQMRVGDSIEPHVRLLRTQKPLELKTLWAVDASSPYYREKNKLGVFYAESWALMHMLHLSEKYRAHVADFVSATLQGRTDAVESAFGQTEAALQRDLRAYVSREPLPFANLPIAPSAKPENIPAEAVSELDSALLLANLFVVSGKVDEASKFYAAIVKAHPNTAEAEAALGYLALAKAEDERAQGHFQRALELKLHNARLCYDLAMLRRQLGAEESEVWDLLRRSVQSDPRLFESRYFLGTLALERRRLSEAIENLKAAAELQPNRPQVWENLSLAYSHNQNHGLARAAAVRAVKLSTNEAETARTEATLALVSRAPAAPTPLKVVVQPPSAAPASRIEGVLTQVDCLGDLARLRIDYSGVKTFLLVRNPRSVTLKGAGAISFEFTCGPVKPRPVIAEFAPGRNDIYGTAGEVRALELR